MRFNVALLGCVTTLSLFVNACGISEGPSLIGTTSDKTFKQLVFTNGQAAAVVIGQTGFTLDANATSASSLDVPWGIHVSPDTGKIFIADSSNNRLVIYSDVPSSPGASADAVVGQPSFTSNASGSSAQGLSNIEKSVTGEGKLIIGDGGNNRITIYNTIPTSNNAAADVVFGAATTSGSGGGNCAPDQIDVTSGLGYGKGKLVASCSNHRRVLIFNAIPTTSGTSADLVLGQADFINCNAVTTSASSMRPSGVWTDGTRLAVTDPSSNRVLLWNSFPTVNNQAADLVLGQTNMTASGFGTTATTMKGPSGVSSNGIQLFVADSDNHRILVWNSWPTTSGQAADRVLGQTDFTSNGHSLTAEGLFGPTDLSASFESLLVVDAYQNRVMVYETQ